MGYKILMVDKVEEEYLGDYSSVQRLIEAEVDLLESYGHQVNRVLQLEEITEEAFANSNCVLAHPTIKKMQILMGLHLKYPAVGLIVTTGPRGDEDGFNQLA